MQQAGSVPASLDLVNLHSDCPRMPVTCRYMESFNSGSSGDTLVLPSNVLERWFSKFENNFRRDPDFLVRRGEMA